jgi:hypothetical protein
VKVGQQTGQQVSACVSCPLTIRNNNHSWRPKKDESKLSLTRSLSNKEMAAVPGTGGHRKKK